MASPALMSPRGPALAVHKPLEPGFGTVLRAPGPALTSPSLPRGQLGRALPATHIRLTTTTTHIRLTVATRLRQTRPCRPIAGAGSDVSGASTRPGPSHKLVLLFVGWYGTNIIFNYLFKATLVYFDAPYLLSAIQLGCGLLWMVCLWSTGLHPRPKLPFEAMLPIGLVGVAHCVGHVAACVSFARVGIPFFHVVKSSEPVFHVILSGLLLGEAYSSAVWLSLLPIVVGCTLTAAGEAAFSLAGFFGAMLSNAGYVLRNIYSKRVLQSNEFEGLDGINLYALLSLAAFVVALPLSIVVEGGSWAPAWASGVAKLAVANGISVELAQLQMLAYCLSGGLFYHLYNQISFSALEEINPVTYSVGNTMKRVVVITWAALAFGSVVTPLAFFGGAMAIAGSFYYSRAGASDD